MERCVRPGAAGSKGLSRREFLFAGLGVAGAAALVTGVPARALADSDDHWERGHREHGERSHREREEHERREHGEREHREREEHERREREEHGRKGKKKKKRRFSM